METKAPRSCLAVALLATMLPAQPATAAAVLSIGFVGQCSLGAAMALPMSGVSKGTTIAFTCWAGSTLPASASSTLTYLRAVQRDAPGKTYSTFPGTTKDRTGGCTLPHPAFCDTGMTLSGGSILPAMGGGPWCGHFTGTFTLDITPWNTSITGSWLAVGDSVIMTGTLWHGSQVGPFVGAATLSANVANSQSCAGTGTTDFLIVGGGTGAKQNGIPFGDK